MLGRSRHHSDAGARGAASGVIEQPAHRAWLLRTIWRVSSGSLRESEHATRPQSLLSIRPAGGRSFPGGKVAMCSPATLGLLVGRGGSPQLRQRGPSLWFESRPCPTPFQAPYQPRIWVPTGQESSRGFDPGPGVLWNGLDPIGRRAGDPPVLSAPAPTHRDKSVWPRWRRRGQKASIHVKLGKQAVMPKVDQGEGERTAVFLLVSDENNT